MRIWVTRHSTGSLHAGGLERCEVWFSKPIFHYIVTDTKHLEDLPFGGNEKYGLGKYGWQPIHNELRGVSFGKLFGYGEDDTVKGLANFVWGKLNEHYGNREFPLGWYEYENEGKCRQEEFIIEIELDISFKEVVASQTNSDG